jgi:hypothetical protein
VDVLDVVVRESNSDNVARDEKGVRNGVGRAMALSNDKDSITAQYDTVPCCWVQLEKRRRSILQ